MDTEKVFEVNNYDGIQINEYNGKISLQSMQKGQNEVWYKRWVFLSKWKDGAPVADDKKRVMGVLLGESKEQAIETLRAIALAIKGQ